MALYSQIKEACKNKKILKVIIGLDNFNLGDTVRKVQSAERAGATYVDIAANVQILKEVKFISSIPVCVSSIDIDELIACYIAGADILEIGNFDIFYAKGFNFSKKQIFNLAKDLRNKLPEACICVTIPHKLSLKEQILLAIQLEKIQIDLIQTEGCSSHNNHSKNHLVHSVSNASSSLSSTYAFAKYINIPIISSSGINPLTAPIAISYGASGVGIGSFFNLSSSSFLRSKNIGSVVYSIQNSLLLNYDTSVFPIIVNSGFSQSTQKLNCINSHNLVIPKS